MIIAKADVPTPSAVLIKASEIPVASAMASGAPACASAANALIIPITVPNSPISVATDATVEMITRFFESIGSSSVVASSNSFG